MTTNIGGVVVVRHGDGSVGSAGSVATRETRGSQMTIVWRLVYGLAAVWVEKSVDVCMTHGDGIACARLNFFVKSVRGGGSRVVPGKSGWN